MRLFSVVSSRYFHTAVVGFIILAFSPNRIAIAIQDSHSSGIITGQAAKKIVNDVSLAYANNDFISFSWKINAEVSTQSHVPQAGGSRMWGRSIIQPGEYHSLTHGVAEDADTAEIYVSKFESFSVGPTKGISVMYADSFGTKPGQSGIHNVDYETRLAGVDLSDSANDIGVVLFDESNSLRGKFPFLTGWFPGLGNVSEVIEESNITQIRQSSFANMIGYDIHCQHIKGDFVFTVCPAFRYRVVRARLNHSAANSNQESLTAGIGSQGMQSEYFVKSLSSDFGTLEATSIFRYGLQNGGIEVYTYQHQITNLSFVASPNLTWPKPAIKDGTTIDYLGYPQIKYVWLNGTFVKKVDRAILEAYSAAVFHRPAEGRPSIWTTLFPILSFFITAFVAARYLEGQWHFCP